MFVDDIIEVLGHDRDMFFSGMKTLSNIKEKSMLPKWRPPKFNTGCVLEVRVLEVQNMPTRVMFNTLPLQT